MKYDLNDMAKVAELLSWVLRPLVVVGIIAIFAA